MRRGGDDEWCPPWRQLVPSTRGNSPSLLFSSRSRARIESSQLVVRRRRSRRRRGTRNFLLLLLLFIAFSLLYSPILTFCSALRPKRPRPQEEKKKQPPPLSSSSSSLKKNKNGGGIATSSIPPVALTRSLFINKTFFSLLLLYHRIRDPRIPHISSFQNEKCTTQQQVVHCCLMHLESAARIACLGWKTGGRKGRGRERKSTTRTSRYNRLLMSWCAHRVYHRELLRRKGQAGRQAGR